MEDSDTNPELAKAFQDNDIKGVLSILLSESLKGYSLYFNLAGEVRQRVHFAEAEYRVKPRFSDLREFADLLLTEEEVSEILESGERLDDYCNKNNISLIDRFVEQIVAQCETVEGFLEACCEKLDDNKTMFGRIQ